MTTPRARTTMRVGAVAGAFLLVAGWVCFEALLVPIGSVRMPGAGFFPLVLGVALGALAVGLFGMSVASPPADTPSIWPERPEVLYLMGILLASVWLFERAGFLVTMTLFLAVATRLLGRLRWGTAVLVGLAGSLAADLVFGRALLIALPSGMLLR